MLEGKHIVLGVTGGIACYKAVDLVSRLKKRGADVRVVMTDNAREFVTPLSFEAISGNHAYNDQFAERADIEHVSLGKWADAFVIAPATANIIAKISCGIADDLLSTTALIMGCPSFIAPAMNAAMWRSGVTLENIERLKARGYNVIGPDTGHLACGDDDIGRMSEPADIVSEIERALSHKRDLCGVSVLVTAGATIERIDPVRYITNFSSGLMGYEIAKAARDRGAKVTLISGHTALSVPEGVNFIEIESSDELYERVMETGENADVIIQAAAPADYTPESVSEQKLKKHGEVLELRLRPTRDIAKALGERKREGQVLVAFAAETENLVENAKAKLVKKNADFIVANDVSREGAGFRVPTNIVTLVSRNDIKELPLLAKREVAEEILNAVSEIICHTRKC